MPLFDLAVLSHHVHFTWNAFADQNSGLAVAGTFLIAVWILARYAFTAKPMRRLLGVSESLLASLARRPFPLVALLCFVWGFGIASALWVFVRRPEPHIHDEASYLLAADTFAHGRWTNPALPADIRAHFEALHIIVAPSYMSKYPPGQGLMLAAGIVLGGNPAVGLWLNAGLVCAAAFYALLPFTPRRWALLGALLTALHPCVLKWTQTFWGGNVPLLASLLLVGAMGRLVRFSRFAPQGSPRGRDAAVLAVGVSIFANCRPFEGLVAAGVCAVPLLPVLWRERGQLGKWLVRFILPAFGVLSVTAALMMNYNRCVAGGPLRMPYAVHEDTYGVVPLFLWQKIKPVPDTLRHDTMRFVNAYTCVYGYWGERDAPINLWRGATDKIELLTRSAFQLFDPTVYWLDAPPRVNPVTDPLQMLPALLLLPGLLLALKRNDATARFAVFGLIAFVGLVLQETFMNPHYGAPVGGLVLLVWVQSWRHSRVLTWRLLRRGANRSRRLINSGRRTALAFTRALVPVYLLSAVACTVAFAGPQWDWLIQDRRPVESVLHGVGGRHLVMVYYGPQNVRASSEWVYNTHDLASQNIIWARYLTDGENSSLIRYFPGRQVWLLNVEQRDHPRLYRYDSRLMGGLPFPPLRTVDLGVVDKVRRGLPTRTGKASGIAALPISEQQAYHEGVAKRSAVHRLFARVKETPLHEDPAESGSPEY